MDRQRPPARCYLLRLWPSGPAEQPVWRASLEDVRTGERLGFAVLEQLFVFLMQQTEHKDGASADPPRPARGEL